MSVCNEGISEKHFYTFVVADVISILGQRIPVVSAKQTGEYMLLV